MQLDHGAGARYLGFGKIVLALPAPPLRVLLCVCNAQRKNTPQTLQPLQTLLLLQTLLTLPNTVLQLSLVLFGAIVACGLKC